MKIKKLIVPVIILGTAIMLSACKALPDIGNEVLEDSDITESLSDAAGEETVITIDAPVVTESEVTLETLAATPIQNAWTGYSWYGSTDDVYTNVAYINFYGTYSYALMDGNAPEVYFEVERDGELVYTSDILSSVDFYYRASLDEASVNGLLPEGTYTITCYDINGVMVDTGSCEVTSEGVIADKDPSDLTVYSVSLDIGAVILEQRGIDSVSDDITLEIELILVLDDEDNFSIEVISYPTEDSYCRFLEAYIVALMSNESGIDSEDLIDVLASVGSTPEDLVDRAVEADALGLSDYIPEPIRGTYTSDEEELMLSSEDGIDYRCTIDGNTLTITELFEGVDVELVLSED